jgi:hypothetical protein
VGTWVHNWLPRVVLLIMGGPELVLDNVLDIVVPRLDVPQSVDWWHVLRILLRHVSLVELALQGEHLKEPVLDPSLLLLDLTC